MKKEEIVQILKQEKIVAIVRMKEQIEVPSFLMSLIRGGIKVLEITANTPGFSEEITNARNLYSTSGVVIGAGTVTNIEIANEAIKAGAQFLVTPNTNIEVIKIAHSNNIPVLMGAATPTEICNAIEHGADIIKLFPAGNLGINYFKAIKAPLDKVVFFVVGGINLSNMKEWMKAGAAGVGLGGVLTKNIKEEGGLESIESIVKKFIQLIPN